MRMMFVTDFHGSRWKYERMFEAAKRLRAEVVINGGDMLPWGNDPFRQGEFITGFLDDHFARFNSVGIYYLCCLGNDDLRVFDKLFEETCNKYPFVFNVAQRKFDLGDYEFIGMNWVVDYPFRLKDRCRLDTDNSVPGSQFGKGLLSTPDGFQEINDWFSYAKTLPTIDEELNRLVRPKDMSKSVYVIHTPPYGIGLDQCSPGARRAGSKALYSFLLKYQPMLSLHGHIHESPETSGRWQANLGRSLCIQPGQLSDFTYVAIDLSTMKFDRIKEKYIA